VGGALRAAAIPSVARAAGPTADGTRGRVLSPAAGFDVAFFVDGLDGLALVDFLYLTGKPATATVAQPDRVERHRKLGFPRGLARFIDRSDVAFNDRLRKIAPAEHEHGDRTAFPVRLRAYLP